MSDKNRCRCETCLYSEEIESLASRQKTPEDKKRVQDLYTRFALTEDDNGMYRGRWMAVRPVLCLLRRDHFQEKNPEIRLEEHEECPMCALIEKI